MSASTSLLSLARLASAFENMAENDLLNEFEDFGITIERRVLEKCK